MNTLFLVVFLLLVVLLPILENKKIKQRHKRTIEEIKNRDYSKIPKTFGEISVTL